MMSVKQRIILLHRDGVSNRQIALQLGIDKNTVNKYVKEYEDWVRNVLTNDPDANLDELPDCIMEQPRYNSSNRSIKVSTQEAMVIIRECMEKNKQKRYSGRTKQQMKKIDMHRYLRSLGYDISYSTVKRICRLMEQNTQTQEAFIKQEYSPGQVCEFDWGEVTLDINNRGYHRYQMAVFTSAYGNYRYAKLYRSQDTAAFQDAHTEFFKFCHGVYHTMVYDNMKVAVKKFVGVTEKEPTDALLQLSIYYGFNFRFCNIRRGNEKGHVERSVDIIRRYAFSFPEDDVFANLEEANIHLLKKCIQKNAETVVDQRKPVELFQQEISYLMPEMPKMSCFIKRANCSVNKYATICVNNVRYSVPDLYIGKHVDVRIYTDRIQIYDKEKQIARHERFYTPGEYHIDIFHYLRTLKRKPGALPQSTALLQADTQIKNIYEKYYIKNPKTFLEVLEIIKVYGVDEVEKALSHLQKISPQDLNSYKVQTICVKQKRQQGENPMGIDHLSKKSKETLKDYDILRRLQGRKVV